MVNAGRVLIIPKGVWTNLTPYEMLDLVSEGDKAYLARQASVGVRPSEDASMTYWQSFGSSASIATTDTPGLVMPDGVTITVDATGLIVASLNVSDLKDIKITNLATGDILAYNGTQSKWVNVALGSAASRNATSYITSGSTDLIESGAVDVLKQTLEQSINGKLGTSDIANNLTTTNPGKVLDATQGKALNDSISSTNTAITNKHKVTRIWVGTRSWVQDTTSQSGTTLYKKSVTLNYVYVASPSVDIANANNSVLPSAAQQTDYDLVEYVTVDDTVPCLYIYASDIPTTGFWINVEGVD